MGIMVGLLCVAFVAGAIVIAFAHINLERKYDERMAQLERRHTALRGTVLDASDSPRFLSVAGTAHRQLQLLEDQHRTLVQHLGLQWRFASTVPAGYAKKSKR